MSIERYNFTEPAEDSSEPLGNINQEPCTHGIPSGQPCQVCDSEMHLRCT